MYDMTIELRTDTGKCLYEQIYEHIRDEIREGKLLCGERLPSTRTLAEYLQISRSTVDLAYSQLESEGYIDPQPYRGYFVCDLENLFNLTGTIQKEKTKLGSNLQKAAETSLVESMPEVWCDFSPNGLDLSEFPFSVWKKITKNVLNEYDTDVFLPGSTQGEEELRSTIARYLHASRGVNCTAKQIIIGAGNGYLLMLLEKILGRHVCVAMESPTYKKAYQILDSFAYPIVTVAMDEHGMRVDELATKEVTAAYVMPSHQYPTGTVMPIGRRTQLLKWAEKEEGRFLIEDDYDSEFRYKGKPIPALQSIDTKGKVIYIGTFSKAIAPAIRVSYMVLPDKLLSIYKQKCSFYSSTVPRLDQKILNEFIRDGYFERYLNKARKLYKAKHDHMLQLLRPFGKHYKISGENAGLHLLLTSKENIDEEILVQKAAQAGIKVYGLSEGFTPDRPGDKEQISTTVLLGYGGLSFDEMTKGVEILKKIWDL